MVIYLGSLVELCCGDGGTQQTNITGGCGECLQCLGLTEFAPAHGLCAFPVYTPGCSAGELSRVGPGLCALARSMPLRFRFLGMPQRHRLSWACVLCPHLVPFPGPISSGNQVLGECTLPRCGVSYHLPISSSCISWVCSCISGMLCASSRELISGYDPPEGCQLSRISGRLG